MPSVKNETKLAQIKEDLEGAGAVWVVDACGLTVKETQALRQAVREAGASMKVYKNTLMHIALADAELPTLDSKTNDTLEIKGGLMEGAAVSAAEVEAIASLPSREELYAHIAAAINGVAQGLATAINGVPRGLAQVTKAVADQKEAA